METKKDPRKCPECGEQATVTCRCMKLDSRCKNGHQWHTCLKHNKIVSGTSDHSKPTLDCSCPEPNDKGNRLRGSLRNPR